MLHVPYMTIGHLTRVGVCMDLVFQHVSKNPPGIGASFASGGGLYVRDAASGALVAQAVGRERIVAMMRRLYENVELLDIRLGEAMWSPDGLAYDFSCTARNWGAGPTVHLKGSSRAVFEGQLIQSFELACDGAAFSCLMDP